MPLNTTQTQTAANRAAGPLLTASNGNETVTLKDIQAAGIHRAGKTCVKETTRGNFAVVASKPRADGSLRLIKIFGDCINARRYNFAIHGDRLGE